jgi:hypothetical protein
MSDTIPQSFVQQFDTSLRMLAAQMDSRLRMAVTDRGTITGESTQPGTRATLNLEGRLD